MSILSVYVALMKRLLSLILVLSFLADPSFAAFTYYKSLTLSEAQSGTADSTDWPLTISLDGNVQAADTQLKDTSNGGVIRPDGYDIYFYSDSALTTRLPAERVSYDGANGKLQAYVKIPSLSTSVDTVIYMAYGDATISSDPNSDGTYGKTSTWNTNFKGVWHMENTSSPSTDSTSNGNSGTGSGGLTYAATGQLGKAIDVDGATGLVTMGASSSLDNIGGLDGPRSASAWIYPRTAGEIVGIIFYKIVGNGGWQFTMLANAIRSQSSTPVSMESDSALSSVSFNAWHHVFTTWAGTVGTNPYKLYLDGAETSYALQSTGTGPPTTDATQVMTIGDRPDTNRAFDGVIDEPRVISGEMTASWILAEYNAQKVSSTFITWGTQTALAAPGCVAPFCGVIGQ